MTHVSPFKLKWITPLLSLALLAVTLAAPAAAAIPAKTPSATGNDLSADVTAPSVPVIDSPVAAAVINQGAFFDVTGIAEDDTAIASVEVEIKQIGGEDDYFLQEDGLLVEAASTVVASLSGASAPVMSWSRQIAGLPAGQYELTAFSTDTAGNQSPATPVVNFSVAVPDYDAPSTPTIDGPPPLKVEVGTPIDISGTAEDDMAIASISFFLLQVAGGGQGGQYLQDDGTLGSSFNFVDVVVDNPGAPSSAWSHQIAALPVAEYELTVQAVDAAGNVSNFTSPFDITVAEEIVVPPVPTVDQQSPLLVDVGVPIDISGTATDDTEVASVQYFLQNPNGPNGPEYLQDDGTFSNTPNGVAAILGSTGQASTTWSAQIPGLAAGEYGLYPFTVDASGNSSPQPAPVNIIVTEPDLTRPATAVVTGPLDGAVLSPGLVTITGSVSDNVGVAGLQVGVLDMGGSFPSAYLQDDLVTFGLPNLFDAGVLNPGSAVTDFSFDIGPLGEGDYFIMVFGVDAAGNRSAGFQKVEIHIEAEAPDTIPPSAAVFTSPANNDVLDLGDVSITGWVADETSIEGLSVIVRKPGASPDQAFLQDDLESFGPFNDFNPGVINPGQMRSEFDFGVVLPDEADYVIEVAGLDGGGNISENWSQINITVGEPDVVPPKQAVIKSPADGEHLESGVVTVSGSVFDNRSVARLSVMVLKVGESAPAAFLQDDMASFGPYNRINPSVASLGGQSSQFSFDIGPLGKGDYKIFVRTIDGAGNVSPKWSVTDIHVGVDAKLG